MNETRINLADYEPSGAGALGESYISKKDPNILLKLYSREREQMGLDEYERACKVYSIGVPCPVPGELVRTEEGLLGIQFRRIVGKRSYARALSEHPERLEEYAARFAEEAAPLDEHGAELDGLAQHLARLGDDDAVLRRELVRDLVVV